MGILVVQGGILGTKPSGTSVLRKRGFPKRAWSTLCEHSLDQEHPPKHSPKHPATDQHPAQALSKALFPQFWGLGRGPAQDPKHFLVDRGAWPRLGEQRVDQESSRPGLVEGRGFPSKAGFVGGWLGVWGLGWVWAGQGGLGGYGRGWVGCTGFFFVFGLGLEWVGWGQGFFFLGGWGQQGGWAWVGGLGVQPPNAMVRFPPTK